MIAQKPIVHPVVISFSERSDASHKINSIFYSPSHWLLVRASDSATFHRSISFIQLSWKYSRRSFIEGAGNLKSFILNFIETAQYFLPRHQGQRHHFPAHVSKFLISRISLLHAELLYLSINTLGKVKKHPKCLEDEN